MEHERKRPARLCFTLAIAAVLLVSPQREAKASALTSAGEHAVVVIGGIAVSLLVLTMSTVRCHSQPEYATKCVGDLRLGLSQHRVIGPWVVIKVINQMIAMGQTSLDIGRSVARDVGLNPSRVRAPPPSRMAAPGN
jgi:hypothetical protein